MPLEIVAAVLFGIALTAVVVMLLAALPGIMDPTAFTRCHECSRWMVDTRHQPDAMCFHCRHAHLYAHLSPWREHLPIARR